jgi:subtilisin family serine protease
MAGSADGATLLQLLADPDVAQVGLDLLISAQLSEAVPLVNLDAMHNRGHTGQGEVVAIVDTGVDIDHPDLADAIDGEQCYCDDPDSGGNAGFCANGRKDMSGAGAGQDQHGHGTRVAGIVTSADVWAPMGGAPDAKILALRVLCNPDGTGLLSDMLLGLKWVRDNRPDVGVINLSLGGGHYPGDCDDADLATMAVRDEVDLLEAAGILLVAGSGNGGSGTGMILPACVAKAVSVGAVWDAVLKTSQTWFGCTDPGTDLDPILPDQVACWSNSSTTTDVFAPGALMTSSLLDGGTATLAGTSYATPVVSACAAALRQAVPGVTTTQLRDALRTSGAKVTDATNGLEYPRLSCVQALWSLVPQVPALPGGHPVRVGAALLILLVGAKALSARPGAAGGSPRTR